MRLTLLLPVVLLFAAACGGDSTEPAASSKAAEGTSSAPTTAAAATKASGSGASTGSGAGSGGAASSGQLDACKLVTSADIARITGLAGAAEILGGPGDPAFCMYGTPAGVQAASLTLTRSNAANDFEALRAAGTENVTGFGEKAHWQASTKTLTILKGGTMLQITPLGGLSDAEASGAKRLDVAKQIATLAVAKQ